MKKLLTCLVICFCAMSLRAQTGSYFLTHHSPAEKNFDNVCFDMTQDNNGIMYFAMKAGVLEFDGREWDLIPGAGAIYALNHNDVGEIFWVGAKGFGKIGYNRTKGYKEIQYLSDSSVTDVFQTVAIGRQSYFLSGSTIYLYNEGQPKAEAIISGNGQGIFTSMFDLFGVLYVQTERNTTFKVENNKLVYVDLNFSGNVIFHSRIDNGYVLGTSDNRVYTCSIDLVMRRVKIHDQPYADANVVIGGTWAHPQLLALGTLRGGVMLLNPITGARDQIIDYSTGLPDNEVFALMVDADHNIWVAHEYGFTQISPSLPFRSYSYFAGLEGNMLCAYSYHNNVYVGTSLGLFKLDKDEVYDEIVTYVDVVASSASPSQTEAPAETRQPQAAEDAPSKKRGFFNFLRRNRGKEKEKETGTVAENNAENNPRESEPPQPVDPNVNKEKRVERVLRSSQHVFKRVEGISAKTTHLVENDGKLIAAGLEGVFEIRDLVAHPVLHSPTRYVYASEKKHTLIASTYDDEVWSLASHAGWQQVNLITGLGDQIDYIFEGPENEWWLCGLDRVYRLQMNESRIERMQTIALTNPNFERTVGVHFRNEIIFVNADGFFRFERQKNVLDKIDSLPKPAQYFALDGHILYRDEHRWQVLGAVEERNNLQLLNLFQNLRYITSDQNPQNLWLISGSNELLKFNGENITRIENKFPIFLKSIENNSVRIADFSEVEIEQTNSAVTFEVVQPDYINPESIEFRYFLEGMHQTWSEWSNANNKINFPYLPPGEYNLKVQARNIFGKVSDLAPVTFEVIPPYWKRPWFYALEFILFASLVILSFRLSTRYRIISRFLSLITIILLIEFIQTVIGSSIVSDDTPVVEFIIQFVVAILILPVEGFLRKLMLRSLDSSSRLYSFLSAGDAPGTVGKKSRRKVKESV